jgi:hypothetical protein
VKPVALLIDEVQRGGTGVGKIHSGVEQFSYGFAYAHDALTA